MSNLSHAGVKGMKWGVRKDRESNKTPERSRLSDKTKTRIRNIAIGSGALVVAVGAAYIARQKMGIKASDIDTSKVNLGRDLTAKSNALKTGILHATRGKNTGFKFLVNGNLGDPLPEYFAVFGTDSAGGDMVKKLSDGRMAARFLDPDGRSDRAGRAIPHEVIIPASMTDGISSVSDVVTKIWPTLKDVYDEVYARPGNEWPRT